MVVIVCTMPRRKILANFAIYHQSRSAPVTPVGHANRLEVSALPDVLSIVHHRRAGPSNGLIPWDSVVESSLDLLS